MAVLDHPVLQSPGLQAAELPWGGGGESQAKAELFLLRCSQTHCQGPKGF